MPERFETLIRFLSEEDALELEAVVLVREGEMVIEIAATDDNEHYLVVGALQGRHWRGTNRSALPDAPAVQARWAELGDDFVGIWREDGREYLFAFDRPAPE